MENSLNKILDGQKHFRNAKDNYDINKSELDVANCVVIEGDNDYIETENIITGVDEFIGSKGTNFLDKNNTRNKIVVDRLDKNLIGDFVMGSDQKGMNTEVRRHETGGAFREPWPSVYSAYAHPTYQLVNVTNGISINNDFNTIPMADTGDYNGQFAMITESSIETQRDVPATIGTQIETTGQTIMPSSMLSNIPLQTSITSTTEMPRDDRRQCKIPQMIYGPEKSLASMIETQGSAASQFQAQLPQLCHTHPDPGRRAVIQMPWISNPGNKPMPPSIIQIPPGIPYGMQITGQPSAYVSSKILPAALENPQVPVSSTSPLKSGVPIGPQIPPNEYCIMQPMYVVYNTDGMQLVHKQMGPANRDFAVKTWSHSNGIDKETQKTETSGVVSSERYLNIHNVGAVGESHGGDTCDSVESDAESRRLLLSDVNLIFQNGLDHNSTGQTFHEAHSVEIGNLETNFTGIPTVTKQSQTSIPAQCAICKNSYQNLSDLRYHELNDHGLPEPANCLFATKLALRGHVNRKSEFHHTCNNCEYAFARPDFLQKHQHYCTKKINPLWNLSDTTKCPICRIYFSDRKHRDIHITSAHTSSAHICCICFKAYTRRSALLDHHAKVHSSFPAKPYECDKCPAEFEKRSQLAQHHKCHTVLSSDTVEHEHDEFECPYCPVKLPTKYYRKKHIAAVHAKESIGQVVAPRALANTNGSATEISDNLIASQTSTVPVTNQFQAEQQVRHDTFNNSTEVDTSTGVHTNKDQDSLRHPIMTGDLIALDNMKHSSSDNSNSVCMSVQHPEANGVQTSIEQDNILPLDPDHKADFKDTCECVHCNITLFNRRHLQAHMQDVHSNMVTDELDEQCNVYVSTKETSTVSGKRDTLLYGCRACNKFNTRDKIELMHHKFCQGRSVRNIRPTCERCNTEFITKPALIQHECFSKFETSGKSIGNVRCVFCNRNFKSKRAMNQHVRLKHERKCKDESAQNMRCDLCNQGFKTEAALVRHKAQISKPCSLSSATEYNRTSRKDKCPESAKRYVSVDSTQAIMSNISDKNKQKNVTIIECKYCSAPFHGMGILFKHESICPFGRSSEKVYENNATGKKPDVHKPKRSRKTRAVTGKQQTKESELLETRSNGNKKATSYYPQSPHHCKICHKFFKSTHYVKVHENVHTRSKLYNLRPRRSANHVTNLNKGFAKSTKKSSTSASKTAATKSFSGGKETSGSKDFQRKSPEEDFCCNKVSYRECPRSKQTHNKHKEISKNSREKRGKQRKMQRANSDLSTKKRAYVCLFCNDTFHHRRLLKRHLKMTHAILNKLYREKIINLVIKDDMQ